jgi:hypothetical protein
MSRQYKSPHASPVNSLLLHSLPVPSTEDLGISLPDYL